MRLFPEVRPDRGFNFSDEEPPQGSDDRSSYPEMTNGDATHEDGDPAVLTDSRLVCITDEKAPRGVLNSNCGFVEIGTYALNRLRRKPVIEFHAWNTPPTIKKKHNDPGKPDRDPLRLARYYQGLLNSGKFESRAALARFLGVSRARVTQVLNRLQVSTATLNMQQSAEPVAG